MTAPQQEGQSARKKEPQLSGLLTPDEVHRGPGLPRIFFTCEMAEAIRRGYKTATTRDHQKPLGRYEACEGTWRRPDSIKPFAIIDIRTNEEVSWPFPLEQYRAEGFDSPSEMMDFAQRHKLRYDKSPHIYFHNFVKESDRD